MAHRPNLTCPRFLKSFTGTRPGPFISYCLWLLLHHKQRSWVVVRDTVGFQNQKYLLSGPLPEKFAGPWHKQSSFWPPQSKGAFSVLTLPKRSTCPNSIPLCLSSHGPLLVLLQPFSLAFLNFFACLCSLNVNFSLGFLISPFLDYNYHLNTSNY